MQSDPRSPPASSESPSSHVKEGRCKLRAALIRPTTRPKTNQYSSAGCALVFAAVGRAFRRRNVAVAWVNPWERSKFSGRFVNGGTMGPPRFYYFDWVGAYSLLILTAVRSYGSDAASNVKRGVRGDRKPCGFQLASD